jgi:META domain
LGRDIVAKLRIGVAAGFAALGVAMSGSLFCAAPLRAEDFPFGMELTLDAPPMHGSKRVPRIEIGDNGEVQFQLWCKSATGQFSVAADSVVFIQGEVRENGCPPDRAAADDSLLAALAGATGWKRQGDQLILTGSRPLRFMLLTN